MYIPDAVDKAKDDRHVVQPIGRLDEALIAAVCSGHKGMVELLLKFGANLRIRTPAWGFEHACSSS